MYFRAVLVVILSCLLFSSCSWIRDDSEWQELFGEKDQFTAQSVDFEEYYENNQVKYKEVTARGEYLTKHLAACGVCHGEKADNPNSALSGGRIIEDERGLIVAPNITPDKETGIADWSVADIVKVVRKGRDRVGNDLSPTMHFGYRWLSDADARAIALYVKSRPAVKNKIESSRGGGINLVVGSKGLELFSPHKDYDGYVPKLSDKNLLYYGEYLANNVANCYGCHTGDVDEPFAGSSEKGVGFFKKFKDFFDWDIELENIEFGSLDREYGDQENFKKHAEKKENKPLERPELVFPQIGPDIRGKGKSEVADWSENQMIAYLSSGKISSSKKANPELCPWPYFKNMKFRDKTAIARYLKSL